MIDFDIVVGSSGPIGDGVEIAHEKRGMSLSGRFERLFDADVDFDIAEGAPESAASCQLGRLGDLDESQNLHPESPCRLFTAWWDGELDVVELHATTLPANQSAPVSNPRTNER